LDSVKLIRNNFPKEDLEPRIQVKQTIFFFIKEGGKFREGV
jgi:hypothetical protein